ncbi:hypothetical protein AWW67_01305 [Roseivirga seohaensis]|uniref:HPr kinase/phosphorylase C-terminal domain-containing protein n=1 Tax=Roseivirga seohaensis TaxID=1914963 RepID=A0A150Y102_9BACT|nr:hypothetical protein [Roseivirga seohaensis]KYG84709.1 hypothetical protein AWW67_01305 [Roseivirga seohaensis]
MTKFHYRIYGFIVQSNQALPSIPDLSQCKERVDVQVEINTLSVPDSLGNNTRYFSYHDETLKVWSNRANILMDYSVGLKAWIKQDNQILIETRNDLNLKVTKQILLQGVLGLWLLMRGKFAIHGCAIRKDKEAIIFAGVSGVGKSTIATACYDLGYSILSDDVSLIELSTSQPPLVVPSFPIIKITPETLRIVGNKNQSKLNHIPIVNKFEAQLGDQFCSEKTALKAIYCLSVDSRIHKLKIESLTGVDKVIALLNNTYRHFMIDVIDLQKEHFNFCTKLASSTSINSITRPTEGLFYKQIIEQTLNV